MTPLRVAHVATVDLSLRFLLLAQLRGLRDAGFDVTAISADGPWVPEIQAEGIRHLAWPHATRAWDPEADLRAFAELVRIFRRERFDLVHTHNPKPGVLGRVAARVAGIPRVVNTVHGLYATPEDPIGRRASVLGAEWIAGRCSDLELYQSAEDLAWARRLHLPRAGRSVLLGNGIDLSRFGPRDRDVEPTGELRETLGFDDEDVVVGTVGRMVLEKGYDEFFRAARVVRSQNPRARFLAIGQSDPDKPDAVTAAQIEAAGEDVIFTGWREDVSDLMRAMDVFVLPSWREGLPRAAIEAAASGLPLVLTDIRGCREVATDDVEGFLVPVRDPVALASAILRLVEGPGLRERMGRAARAKAEASFDERRVVQMVVRSTIDLIGSPEPSSPGPTTLRRASSADVRTMARLHRSALPTAFLPTLGERFLGRLYRSIVEDPEADAWVAVDRGQVIGFATAVPSVRAFYRRFVRRDGLAAAVAAAPRLISPSVARRAIETARHPTDGPSLPDAELLSIAVAPAYRSSGVGGELVVAIRRSLAGRGVGEMKVVVGADNEGANRFYERIAVGAPTRVEVHEGTPSNVWVLTCPS